MIAVQDLDFLQTELGDLGAPVAAARSLFHNSAMVNIAGALIYRHPLALEYLRTAPVLALGASYGKIPRRASEYGQIAGMFANRLDSRPKLRDLMKSYRIAPQLRAIDGKALSPNKWPIIRAISHECPASTLAQSIPEKSFHQHLWLIALDRWWRRACLRHPSAPVPIPVWAVSHFNRFTETEQMSVVYDLLDFALGREDRFDERWTFDQAHAAMERWHSELGRMSADEKFKDTHGIGFREVFKVKGLPEESQIGSFRFVLLSTGQAMQEEGKAMHHCLSTYTGSCIKGAYAAYSILNAKGKRVATFGLRWDQNYWCSDQVKGPCNRGLPADVHFAVQEFLNDYRKSRGGK